MGATGAAADGFLSRVVTGAFAKDTDEPALSGRLTGAPAPRGRSGAGVSRKRHGTSETTSPAVVFQSIQNLPESLKWVFFLHHKVIIKLSFLLFA